MNKKPFNANIWLQKEFSTVDYSHRSSFETSYDSKDDKNFDITNYSLLNSSYDSTIAKNSEVNTQEKKFHPGQFLTPDLQEVLFSKNALKVKKFLVQLHRNVLALLKSSNNFNKTLKQAIYGEFLIFAESKALNFSELDNANSFWKHIYSKSSEYRKELDQFIHEYAFRVAFVYLFKIRYIIVLCSQTQIPITTKDLMNPGSILSQIFKKGSSTELCSEALQSNHYSWYRPTYDQTSTLEEYTPCIQKISAQELLMLTEAEIFNQEQDSSQDLWAHSLSHNQFGRFLNLLLFDFPKWAKKGILLSPNKNTFKHQDFPQILTSKYTGDQLNSLSLSYWTAKNLHDSERLNCPEFIYDEPNSYSYFKICLELQFLTSLVCEAKKFGHHPVSFICTTMRLKRENKDVTDGQQISMFPIENIGNDQKFDRIVLNLNQFPKNNPHFYLINKINSQVKNLKDNGLIYILSTKKLFVPSQSEKVEQILAALRPEGSIVLEGLKGKGEIPSYLYIFSKRSSMSTNLSKIILNDLEPPSLPLYSPKMGTNHNEGVQKLPCLSFDISGELTSFNKFSSVVDSFYDFFSTKSIDNTSLFQCEINSQLIFEFYHDVIVEGRLIHSSNRESAQITHPVFFKNLMTSCIPLDHYFHIETLTPEFSPLKDEELKNSPSFLGPSFIKEEKYSYILIIDFRDAENPCLEISAVQSFRGKVQEYGFSLCHYFGLIPKRSNININLFREFFNSNIGLQIIRLSLNGGINKLKAKLGTIFIPKFLDHPKELPAHLSNNLELFTSNSDELLALHPEKFQNSINQLWPILQTLGQNYPWRITGLLSYFLHTLSHTINLLDDSRANDIINYSNPYLIESLVKAKTVPIFPQNKELFYEFVMINASDIHLPLTDAQIKNEKNSENHYLQLTSAEGPIVKIYSDIDLLNFLKFILSPAAGVSISQLLQNICIPTTGDLKKIVNDFRNMNITLSMIHKQTSEQIERLFKEQIIST